MAQISEVKLYGGAISCSFNNNARNRYVMHEGDKEPWSPVGVTTVLRVLSKEGLMLWPLYEAINFLKKHVGKELTAKALDEAILVHTKKSTKGKDVGTDVHGAIEKWLADPTYVFVGQTDDADRAFDAFVQWFKKSGAKVLATEQIIYSRELDYAGTYDALLEIDGKVVLCDVKTTNPSKSALMGIYPENFIQLGGYVNAHLEENPMEEIDDVMVINCNKLGACSTLRGSELGFEPKELAEHFRSCLGLYRLMDSLKYRLGEV